MNTQRATAFEPNYASSPGDVIGEWLEEKGMTQTELAVRLGLSAKTLNLIIKGTAPLSYETANKLEKVTSIPARFWNATEAAFQEFCLKLESSKMTSKKEEEFSSMFPIKILRDKGVIKSAKSDKNGVLNELLSFFQVSSVESWDNYWKGQILAYRKSSVYESKIGAIATWLRLGEIQSDLQELKTFNKRALLRSLPAIKSCSTIENPNIFLEKVREILNDSGVAFILLPEIPGTHCSGVTRWVLDRPIVQLSLRYKTDDHLWFTLFHEIGHVLLHPRNLTFLESDQAERTKDSKKMEAEANQFAQDLLIPTSMTNEFPTLTTPAKIINFANRAGIAPGIVVGRLQMESHIKFSFGNELKKKYTFK